jgi:uncharacterized membrane protein
MDMDQAAVFLAGSILTALGFVVVAIGIVVSTISFFVTGNLLEFLQKTVGTVLAVQQDLLNRRT